MRTIPSTLKDQHYKVNGQGSIVKESTPRTPVQG